MVKNLILSVIIKCILVGLVKNLEIFWIIWDRSRFPCFGDRSGLTSNSFSTVAMEIDHATRVTIVANRMTVTIIATRVIIALIITVITANVVFIHIRSLPVTEAASSGVIP